VILLRSSEVPPRRGALARCARPRGAGLLVALSLLAAGCREASPPPPPSAVAVPAEALRDGRTQLDFAKEWAEVVAISDEQQRDARAAAMRSSWEGRRYRWYGYALPGLCFPESRRCVVHVFERGDAKLSAALGGSMPELRLTEAGYAALAASCRGKAACVVSFEGLLAEARTDPQMPLGLVFDGVEIEGARDPAPGERWWREALATPPGYTPRAPRADPKDAAVAIDLGALKQKQF
jgi:hypothetical protein